MGAYRSPGERLAIRIAWMQYPSLEPHFIGEMFDVPADTVRMLTNGLPRCINLEQAEGRIAWMIVQGRYQEESMVLGLKGIMDYQRDVFAALDIVKKRSKSYCRGLTKQLETFPELIEVLEAMNDDDLNLARQLNIQEENKLVNPRSIFLLEM